MNCISEKLKHLHIKTIHHGITNPLTLIRHFTKSPVLFKNFPKHLAFNVSVTADRVKLVPTYGYGGNPPLKFNAIGEYVKKDPGPVPATFIPDELMALRRQLNEEVGTQEVATLDMTDEDEDIEIIKKNASDVVSIRPFPQKKKKTTREDGGGYGRGGRKSSFAQAWVFPNGDGRVIINGKPLVRFFSQVIKRATVLEPLQFTDTLGLVDTVCKVEGGGFTGQAEALRQAIANALVNVDPEYRGPLKTAGLHRRDPRGVERKKPGLHKARKGYPWHKR